VLVELAVSLYVVSGVHFSKYRKIQVEPVSLRYLSEPEKHKEEDLVELAGIFQGELEKKLGERFVVVGSRDQPDEATLVISPALVHVGTPMRTLNVVTSAVLWTPVTSGAAAFEAKIKDGTSGVTLAEIAEKQIGGKDMKSLTVGSYTKYDHAAAGFKEWSQQLLEMLQAPEYR